MRKVIATIFLGFVVATGSVYAACYNDCEAVPDCAEMGYKLKGEIFCPDGSITCPFDPQYIWCKEYKCSDGRYSDTATLTGEKGYRCDEVEYHKRTCYHCHCDPDPKECKWSNLNKGNGELGERCCDGHYASCKNLCKNTVTVPDHAHGVEETCTGCGETKDIITSWKCNDWYDELNGACYARPCANDYSITEPNLDSCGDKHLGSSGWEWESNGYMGEQICGKCTPKSCLPSYSTDYPKVESCGKTGDAGWNFEQSDQYAGDEVCGKCAAKSCLGGYSTNYPNVASCGTSGDKGWTWEQSNQYAGDEVCGKCVAKTCTYAAAPSHAHCTSICYAGDAEQCNAWDCSEGYKKTADGKGCEVKPCDSGYAIAAEQCGNGKGGYELGEEGSKSGTNTCRKCMPKSCPNNEKTEYSDVSKCGTSGGWTSHGTGHYAGDTECYECTANGCAQGYDIKYPDVNSCGQKGSTGWDHATSGYAGNSVCGKCTKKNCPQDYSTSKPDENSCGTKGGWNWSQQGWSGDEVCGKCTEKSCPQGEDTSNDASKCGTSGENGWTKPATGSHAGNAACYKCEKKGCRQGLSTSYQSVNDCTSGSCATYHSEGYSGDQKCGVCYYTVDEQVPDNATCTDTAKCERGTACTKWECKEGYTKSADGKKCDVAKCPEGYDVEKQSGSDCGEGSGWSVEFGGKSGNKNCGKCKCTSSCTWNDKNKGTAELSNPCCNGNFATCTSTCKKVEIPQNAMCKSDGWCTGCSNSAVCTAWECKQGYRKSNDICVPKRCEIGDVYYEDGTCDDVSKYVQNSSPRPIGVIYWLNEEHQGGKVINLKDLGRKSSSSDFDPEKPYNTGYSYFNWASSSTDITDLENWNCSNNDYKKVAATGDHKNSFWSAGISYTKAIADAQGNDMRYPAAAALAFYPYTDLKTNSKVGQGQWYLPTLGEMMDLYGYNYPQISGCSGNTGADGNTKSMVNATLSALKSKSVDAKELSTNKSYWSSSEFSSSYAWELNMSTGKRDYNNKSSSSYAYYIRVGLEIGCPSGAVLKLPEHAKSDSTCIALSGETKYKKFECEDGYYKNEAGTACNSCASFESLSCAVGSVYYVNGKCSSVNDDYLKCSTPIGVVYWVTEDGKHGKVINLQNLGRESTSSAFNPEDPYNTAAKFYWGYDGYDLSNLTNYDDENNMLQPLKERATELYDGKGNTDRILEATKPQCEYDQNQKEYYQYCMPQAAQAAHDFYPPNVDKKDSKVGQGQWYLPTLGELMDLYGYDNDRITKPLRSKTGENGDHKKLVNNTLDVLKSKGFVAEKLEDASYWSSTELTGRTSWELGMSEGARYSSGKDLPRSIRVSLDFGCPNNAISTLPEHAIGTKCTTASGETKYKSFVCARGYMESNGKCVTACSVGDVFYANGLCGKVADYKANSSPKPVGVVYHVWDGGAHGKVINLHDLGKGSDGKFNPADPYSTSSQNFLWAASTTRMSGLSAWNCLGLDYRQQMPPNENRSDVIWTEGKEDNTAAIVKALGNDLQYAAPAVVAFYPLGVSPDDPKVGAGQWYLPAIGELMDLYGYNYGDDYKSMGSCESSTGAQGNTKNVVNATLQALKDKGVTAEKLTDNLVDNYYWSSSSYDSTNLWSVSMKDGYRSRRQTNNYVRAALQF